MARFEFLFLVMEGKVIAANRDCVCAWRESIEMAGLGQQLPGSWCLCSGNLGASFHDFSFTSGNSRQVY